MSGESEGMVTEAVNETTPTSINDVTRKMKLKGIVTRLELYGAFLDVGIDTQALIHISQLGTERVNRVADVLQIGQEVDVWVHKVEPAKKQLMVTMIEPLSVEWRDLKVGQEFTGKVNRLETFGAFIDIGAERDGLVHISELSHDYVKHPSEVVSVGDEVQVQVLQFKKSKKRIDLSMKALMDKPETEAVNSYQAQQSYDNFDDDFEEDEFLPTAMELAMRKAMGDGEDGRSRKKKKRRKRRRSRRRAEQEELLSRTLEVQEN